MNRIYLVRHDAAKNMHRFYQMFLVQGLLGEWSLIREWGRVGSPGTVRKDWFETEEEADDCQANAIRCQTEKRLSNCFVILAVKEMDSLYIKV